jgi:cell pole-organizing protein PopZ
MSGSHNQGARTEPDQPGNDPSMEDILASIRRILSEEDTASQTAPASPPEPAPPEADKPEDVLVLDSSMLVQEAPQTPVNADAEQPVTGNPDSSGLLAPETEAAASTAVGQLVRTLASERTVQVSRGGPTLEDMVREELRPLLKQWLDAHLPEMVERLVRAEIERVMHRAVR